MGLTITEVGRTRRPVREGKALRWTYTRTIAAWERIEMATTIDEGATLLPFTMMAEDDSGHLSAAYVRQAAPVLRTVAERLRAQGLDGQAMHDVRQVWALFLLASIHGNGITWKGTQG